MTIKKILIALLSLVFVFTVSCGSNLEPETSQSGSGGSPDDLIIGVGDGAITRFINAYAGLYYNQNQVKYKLKDGKLYTPYNKEIQVQAVSSSAKKMQIKYADEGKIEVLKFNDKGYVAYTSFILEKASSEVLIKNEGIGGSIPELAKYKGTYNSISSGNKIKNYIAIDENGGIYFHDPDVTLANGRVEITKGDLTILETQINKHKRNIVFKFDQSVYREYNINGGHIETTGEGFTKAAGFVDDIGNVKYVGSYNNGKNISFTFTAKGDLIMSGSPYLNGDMNDNAIKLGNTVKIMRNDITLTLNGNSATYKDAEGRTIALTKEY